MIGTNSSMSFQKPVGWIAKITRRFWQRQERTLFLQLAEGVRFFDIRVQYRKPAVFIRHQYYCHGRHRFVLNQADETEKSRNFVEILQMLQLAGSIVSLTLDRGDEEDREIFRQMKWHELFKDCVQLVRIRTGRNAYEDVFRSEKLPEIVDMTLHKKWWQLITPKAWAMKHNKITDREIESNKIYLYDYYNL